LDEIKDEVGSREDRSESKADEDGHGVHAKDIS
jgi:hypothetical protein